MAKVETNIDPKRKYSLVDIVTEGLMPWARNSRTVRKIIEQDRKGHNLLKTTIKGRSGQRRYEVLGDDLIAYLTIAGPYLIGAVRKNQKHVRKNRSSRDTKKGRA